MVCPLLRGGEYRWFMCFACVLREKYSLFETKIQFGYETKYLTLQLKSIKVVSARVLKELRSKLRGEDYIPNIALYQCM